MTIDTGYAVPNWSDYGFAALKVVLRAELLTLFSSQALRAPKAVP